MKARELEGKVALITGASKGLGKAMSLALAEAGAKVALVSRDKKLLGEVATAVRTLGAEAEVFPADVSDEAQVLALEKAVAARFGKLHILINNAGINLRKPITDFTLEEWNRIQTTNVTSALDATVSGVGVVTYYGTPQVTQHISGAGTVRQGR